jgi:signal peptidase II
MVLTTAAVPTARAGLRWLALSLVIIVLDQLTKVIVLERFAEHERMTVFAGFFDWTLRFNEGVAFSFLVGGPDWQRYGLAAFAITAAIIFAVWLTRLPQHERWSAAAIAMVIGGALGNAIDRLRLGHVVDFILVYWNGGEWPAFNVADSAICVGAVLLAIATLREHRHSEARDNGAG